MNEINFALERDFELKKVLQALKGHELYLVGGYVRDFLLFGKISNDKDIIVADISSKEAAQIITDSINGHLIELDSENQIYRVVSEDKQTFFDIVNPVDNDIQKDIQRRDFTINAICFDVQKNTILDIVGGCNDLQNKKIRMIDEKNFEDDPLRVLRAFRFFSVLDFEFDDNLKNVLQKYSPLLERCAIERINYELTKMFEGKKAHEAIIELDKIGLLEKYFPIINELKKIPKNAHHHLDLFNHSVETVKQVQTLFDNASVSVQSHLQKKDLGQFSRLAYLKIAAFLHDIGKPSTWTIDPETQRHRFIKHDEVGGKLLPDVVRKMKFSNKQISYMKNLVKNHIYPAALVSNKNVLEKAKMRFFRKLEENTIDVILLAKADRLSARGVDITEEIVSQNINGLSELLKLYLETKNSIKPLPKLLSGNEVMNILNIKPSPILGKILTELKEEQISGNIQTKEEAIDFIRNFHY